MAQVFRHGNAEVSVVIEDRVVHFKPKFLALTPVVRLDMTDSAAQIESAVHGALDEAIEASANDLRAALKAAMDWAEERFGLGQLT